MHVIKLELYTLIRLQVIIYLFEQVNCTRNKQILLFVLGDNILTALSVAKECGIIEAGESVVEVSAEEENSKAPQIRYSCGGNTVSVSLLIYS